MRLGILESSWFVEGRWCGAECGVTVAPLSAPHIGFELLGSAHCCYAELQGTVQKRLTEASHDDTRIAGNVGTEIATHVRSSRLRRANPTANSLS